MDRLALDRFFADTEDVLEHWDGSDDAMFGEAPGPGTEDEPAPPGESYYEQYDGHDEERADSSCRYYENRLSGPVVVGLVVGQRVRVRMLAHWQSLTYQSADWGTHRINSWAVVGGIDWAAPSPLAEEEVAHDDRVASLPPNLGRESGLVPHGLLRPVPTDDARIDFGYPTVAEIAAREEAIANRMFPPTLPF